MSIQKIMNLMLIEEFPELKTQYEEEINWQEGDETGSHVIYGDIFAPFIKEKIKEKNDIKLERICDFIEELIKMKNDPVNYIDPRGKEMYKFYYKITPQIYEGEIKYIDNEYSFDFFPYRNSDIYIIKLYYYIYRVFNNGS